VVIIVFIQQSFRSTTSDLGLLAIFWGIGLFAGALGYGRWGGKISHFKAMFLCLALGGVMLIVFSWVVRQTQNLVVAAGLSLIIGLIAGPIFIGANTIIHQVSHNEMRGKVFSGLEVVIHFAFLLAMLLSSFLAEHIERFWILVGIGVIFLGVGLVGLRRAPAAPIFQAGSN
jgi:MFS family permease